jgi:hypothetical protein
MFAILTPYYLNRVLALLAVACVVKFLGKYFNIPTITIFTMTATAVPL